MGNKDFGWSKSKVVESGVLRIRNESKKKE